MNVAMTVEMDTKTVVVIVARIVVLTLAYVETRQGIEYTGPRSTKSLAANTYALYKKSSMEPLKTTSASTLGASYYRAVEPTKLPLIIKRYILALRKTRPRFTIK